MVEAKPKFPVREIDGGFRPGQPQTGQGDLLVLGNPHDQLVAIAEVVNVLREGGPVEVKPKVVLAG